MGQFFKVSLDSDQKLERRHQVTLTIDGMAVRGEIRAASCIGEDQEMVIGNSTEIDLKITHPTNRRAKLIIHDETRTGLGGYCDLGSDTSGLFQEYYIFASNLDGRHNQLKLNLTFASA